jgi:S-(hydroxymethyl)glutathione dehydrogenase/alcohol dehydrogenase
MITAAAVLVETGQPLELVDLTIPALKPGQVLVDVAFSGVCHTQLLEARGRRGEDAFLPHCLGHEASGIVREVGADVTKCHPGDHVILSWIKGSGTNVPGTVYDWNGRNVNAGGVTTFSRQSVVSENRVSVIPQEFDMRRAALLGCAVPTGVGAVFNTLQLQAGQSVAVFGTGGIGLCAVAAAVIRRAEPVIAVDINAARLQAARNMGAHHTIDATACDPVDEVRRICPSGVDAALEASGRPEVILQALEAVRSQGGAAVVIGNVPHGETIALDPALLNQGKRLLGTWGGDSLPDRDFPKYCDLVNSGDLDLEPLLSAPYALAAVNTALDDLESRRVTRPLLDMSLM